MKDQRWLGLELLKRRRSLLFCMLVSIENIRVSVYVLRLDWLIVAQARGLCLVLPATELNTLSVLLANSSLFDDLSSIIWILWISFLVMVSPLKLGLRPLCWPTLLWYVAKLCILLIFLTWPVHREFTCLVLLLQIFPRLDWFPQDLVLHKGWLGFNISCLAIAQVIQASLDRRDTLILASFFVFMPWRYGWGVYLALNTLLLGLWNTFLSIDWRTLHGWVFCVNLHGLGWQHMGVLASCLRHRLLLKWWTGARIFLVHRFKVSSELLLSVASWERPDCSNLHTLTNCREVPLLCCDECTSHRCWCLQQAVCRDCASTLVAVKVSLEVWALILLMSVTQRYLPICFPPDALQTWFAACRHGFTLYYSTSRVLQIQVFYHLDEFLLRKRSLCSLKPSHRWSQPRHWWWYYVWASCRPSRRWSQVLCLGIASPRSSTLDFRPWCCSEPTACRRLSASWNQLCTS